MKIKIFSSGDIKELERNVNEFLKNEDIKKVIDIKQSESIEGQQQCWSLTYTIIYDEHQTSAYEEHGIVSL